MKRAFDFTAALAALVLLAPALLAIAALVRVRLGSPVLFRQIRPGRRGRLFTIWKFRTMRDIADAGGKPRPDAERLTRFGSALRAASLDELPELWNVLRGDMSLVGPRPLLARYLPRYSPEQARRHEVRPGLTGWAQVNGRNALTWNEKFRLDVWYVDHRTFWLDLKIIGLTLVRVVRREGISAAGAATMPEFHGSPPPDGGGEGPGETRAV
jgi:lipopolysaccharide/colanic/teichoic acid biosynthesis glycosyltransferase